MTWFPLPTHSSGVCFQLLLNLLCLHENLAWIFGEKNQITYSRQFTILLLEGSIPSSKYLVALVLFENIFFLFAAGFSYWQTFCSDPAGDSPPPVFYFLFFHTKYPLLSQQNKEITLGKKTVLQQFCTALCFKSRFIGKVFTRPFVVTINTYQNNEQANVQNSTFSYHTYRLWI